MKKLPCRAPCIVLWFAGLMTALLACLPAHARDYAAQRQQMLQAVRKDVAMSDPLSGKGLDEAVLEAMGRVPRHEFVPEGLRGQAYDNRPLPIGYGQTISQPTVVALMTDLLRVGPEDRVLEVGTGSGYQAAVLSGIVAEVQTMEIIPELAGQARERLRRLGYDNVTVHTGDGYYGLEGQAPFDGIMVTAAASHVPPPLIRQLKPEGRMVIPVGGVFMVQDLLLVTRHGDGTISTENLMPVRFVPLTGEH